MIFSELLKNSVDKSEYYSLNKELLSINIQRGRLLAKVTSIMELVILAISISTYALKVDKRFDYPVYLFMYILMVTVNGIFLMASSKVKKHKVKNNLYVKTWGKYIVAYITFFMVWGSVLTLEDQKIYGQIIVYMVNMVTCSAFFYLDNRKVLIPFISSLLILLIGLPFFQKSTDVLVGHYVNVIVLAIIAFFGSRIMFIHFCNEFRIKTLLKKTNAMLADEIERNKLINIKLEKANEGLKELTLIDELTCIPNRRSLKNFIDFSFYYKSKRSSLFSVIMMDIDYFKQYNDNYGHNAGDKVLYYVAQEINQVITYPKSFTARYGGEEFILISLDTDEKQIKKTAEIIRQRIIELNIPHEFSRISKVITLSLGTSTMMIESKEDILNCIELADRALYLAKSKGRNCVESF